MMTVPKRSQCSPSTSGCSITLSKGHRPGNQSTRRLRSARLAPRTQVAVVPDPASLSQFPL